MEVPTEDPAAAAASDAIRFEDLTVDDDLPIIDRIVHYTSSQIALQRLVHIKMLAETSELAGKLATQKVLIPLLEHLLSDAEAVIRQHIAGQLFTLSMVALYDATESPNQQQQQYSISLRSEHDRDPVGYELLLSHVIPYLNELITDPELDVRRAAVDALAGISVHLKSSDVCEHIMPMARNLASQKPLKPSASKKRTEEEQRLEELRITACNLLAETGGAAAESSNVTTANNNTEQEDDYSSTEWVRTDVIPLVLELCQDLSFRVRRSAAQALPRVMGAATVEQAKNELLPMFQSLASDEVHRVRKSSGECLVDMSRALVILAEQQQSEEQREALYQLRRETLLPIADDLIQDSHKQVRQGMMQFLGPFMASFYPYQYSPLHSLLPTHVESDGSHHTGIVAQFFPHASSMVARLNSSQNTIALTPTPVHSSLDPFVPKVVTDMDRVQRALPEFLRASRMSALSLAAVTSHRREHPPRKQDLDTLTESLLDYYVALSVVSTGDENTDAEMRVYCAYSFPALVLLLGPENWEGSMRTCFMTLLNPKFGMEEEESETNEEEEEPPLPVKRCLASSLHTVAHVLGPEIAAEDVIPAVRQYFMRDTDDSVRLNMIRNFPALLSVLPESKRKKLFLNWSEVIQGEDFLGGRKRSATNPLTLNWRQRDYLARTLPEVIGLVCPSLLHDHVWPILKILLTDGVNDVRDDALWAVAMLLRAYCADTIQRWGSDVNDPKAFSENSCAEVVGWVVDNILRTPSQQGSKSRPACFSDRQLFCRICGSVGLALRLSEDLTADERRDAVSVLTVKFKFFFLKKGEHGENATDSGPYQRMSDAEVRHLKKILSDKMLPHALEMKEDRISNVRITLMKVLQILPYDIRTSGKVKPVLKALEEENETWTSFGEETLTQEADQPTESEVRNGQSSSGPVDVDITPASSQDNDEVPEDDGASMPVAASKSLMSGFNGANGDSGLRTVIFSDGPIGMQLEPTADDSGCRVYEFSNPSPAQDSGKVLIGDVIVSVNGVTVSSYDETVELLKKGGSREVSFRDGLPADVPALVSDDEDAQSTEDGDRPKKKKKKKKKDDGSVSSAPVNDDDDASKTQKKSRKKKKEKVLAGEEGNMESEPTDTVKILEKKLRREKKKKDKKKKESSD